jgi:hypothetical protein
MPATRACDRRLLAAAVEIEELARRLLPEPVDPNDPLALLSYLTDQEIWRLEAAVDGASDDPRLADEWSDSARAVWDDARRRAMARMLTGADMRVLNERESAGRVLVRVARPPSPERTCLVCYLPDQAHADLWHVETCYRDRELPNTMTTAELAEHDPQPWPPRVPIQP